MFVSEMFGVAGTAIVIAGYVPQVRHLVKEHCSAGISVPAFALWCASSTMFLVHAIMIRDAIFISLQALNTCANAVILFYARRYRDQFCPIHGGRVHRRGSTNL